MTTRISKACHECRARKVRCNGEQPCRLCLTRGTPCEYRAKARIRARKSGLPAKTTAASLAANGTDDAISEVSQEENAEVDRDFNVHSVAATHQASPSCLLQLYYGPSSMFSLMNSIYHQIEGTRPNSPSRQGVEEMGPGLDLFRHRRLFFGHLADSQPSQPSQPNLNQNSAIFLDESRASQFLEQYLSTYWQAVPAIPRDEHRNRLRALMRPPALFDLESEENLITLTAMATGAYLLDDTATSEFLYSKVKAGAAKMDEAVNVNMVQLYLMMGQLQMERAFPNSAFLHIGTATRRAMAVGLHKDAGGRAGEGQQDVDRRRILYWSMYFWETWICFILGRVDSIPDIKSNVPLPPDQIVLQAGVDISRIMAKCAEKIYIPRHESLLVVWKSANDIRADLHKFKKNQTSLLGFEIGGPIQTGECGLAQAMLTTKYYHTMSIAYRPFLILRAKLKKRHADAQALGQKLPNAPPWLDQACQHCLDAAKNAIGFLEACSRSNRLCRSIKFHNFFIEGACFILAFDLIQDKDKNRDNLKWLQSAISCVRFMLPQNGGDNVQLPATIEAVERMVRSVIPEFTANINMSANQTPASDQSFMGSGPGALYTADTVSSTSSGLYPNMGGGAPGPNEGWNDEMDDFTAANLGLDFDFGTMDMDAFLSIDPAQDWTMHQ